MSASPFVCEQRDHGTGGSEQAQAPDPECVVQVFTKSALLGGSQGPYGRLPCEAGLTHFPLHEVVNSWSTSVRPAHPVRDKVMYRRPCRTWRTTSAHWAMSRAKISGCISRQQKWAVAP